MKTQGRKAEKKVDLSEVKDSIVKSLQKYSPVEDTDIDDFDAIPLKEDASDISFDNFEKENASEKKRKFEEKNREKPNRLRLARQFFFA